MKTIVYLALLAACPVFAQPTDYRDWKVNFRIADEVGKPVDNADITVFYDWVLRPDNTADAGKISGITDTNGIFTASHHDKSTSLRFLAQKADFYPTDIRARLHRANRPEELNRDLSLVLKKVGKPIAMYAKWVNENTPVQGQPVGYDLMVGDWVGSNGKGITADIVFQNEDYQRPGADYEHKVKVSFPKPGDGIQIYTIPDSEQGSSLRSPHEVPVDGYQAELNKERSAHPGQPTKNDDDPNRIYLFRVRTVLDQDGKVVSAHYGKIYGDFMQFTYYLNPTPNDRNIEFDPKQNLLGGLKSFEQVSAP